MAATKTKPTADHELRQLGEKLVKSIGETLGPLLGRDVVTIPARLEIVDGEELQRRLGSPCVAVRAATDKDTAGRCLRLLFDGKDACAMAGHLLLTPADELERKRALGCLQGEDAAAFAELVSVLLSGFANILRERQVDSELQLIDTGALLPSTDGPQQLPPGPLVAQSFRLQLASHPETTGYLIVDPTTGESWNKAPLCSAAAGASASRPPRQTKAASQVQGRTGEEEALDDVPQAPIRGTAAAFLLHAEILPLLRRACRRTGLELRKHGRAEIPNPAAHRNEIVVIDVPAGEERRFDWCRRLKEFSDEIRIVVLLHQPSRARVTQAFLSKADVILGLPCAEAQLTQKLDGLLGKA